MKTILNIKDREASKQKTKKGILRHTATNIPKLKIIVNVTKGLFINII
jgi:hypothetical protein